MWMCALVSFASSISRLTAISSFSLAMPRSPSMAETLPSCMTPCLQSEQSSEWLIQKLPNMLEYSSAALITLELVTGRPSSLKATAPASIRSPISTISLPPSPLLIAAIGKRSISPQFLAFSIIALVIEALSFTGFVLAMQRQVVTPPATAACEPEIMSSLYS